MAIVSFDSLHFRSCASTVSESCFSVSSHCAPPVGVLADGSAAAAAASSAAAAHCSRNSANITETRSSPCARDSSICRSETTRSAARRDARSVRSTFDASRAAASVCFLRAVLTWRSSCGSAPLTSPGAVAPSAALMSWLTLSGL